MTRAAVMGAFISSGAGVLTREQFEDFYNRTAARLLAYIRRISGNPAIADDLLQESYVRLLNAPSLPEGRMKSYLYRVATNLVTDYHRAQSRRRRWEQTVVRQAEAADSGIELAPDLERLFLRISPQERALLWLAYVEQAEHREIAGILGIGERSVRVLLSRARAKMEVILKTHGFEGRQ